MKEENILKTLKIGMLSLISIIVILVILGDMKLISDKIVLIIGMVLIFGSILTLLLYYNRISKNI